MTQTDATAPLSKEEFCARFVARVIQRAGEKFDDGSSIREYAEETAPSYWEDYHSDDPDETPEECADADMSYWGE
jgi:hypothetical protein